MGTPEVKLVMIRSFENGNGRPVIGRNLGFHDVMVQTILRIMSIKSKLTSL